MNRRRLGAAGPEVSVLGLGCMPRDEVAISVKFGALRDPASGWHGTDGRPESVPNFLGYTLRRLGTDHVTPSREDGAGPRRGLARQRSC
jgi:aryl-alcohol dehydrogenase-like predicted oxidoreductase